MDKNELIRILEDWNFWKKELSSGTPREQYLALLTKMLAQKQVLVVMGPRRSGKSFLLRQLAKQICASGIRPEQILMVNFEDPRFNQLNTQLLDQIYETVLEFFPSTGERYIFLDEVQEIPQWEKWVNTMQELNKAQLIVSGSNAKLLSQELSTLLTGRHLDITIFPLSFREFLVFNGLHIQSEVDIVHHKISILALLRTYIIRGSFPKVVLTPTQEEQQPLLLTYFDDSIHKDIIKRYRIRKGEKLKALAKFYFSNISSLITFNSCGKFLDIAPETVEKFSSYLEQSYLVFFLKRFSFTLKEQEKSPRKVYAVDTGLAQTIGFRVSENWGKMMENIVFLELQRMVVKDSRYELYYWKNARHEEVDFVVKHNTVVEQLIQVCADMRNSKTRKREVGGLLKAMDELRVQSGLIITEDEEGEEIIEDKKIVSIPLYRWLLTEEQS